MTRVTVWSLVCAYNLPLLWISMTQQVTVHLSRFKKVDMFRKFYFHGAKFESGVSWHDIICITHRIDTDIDIGILVDIGILNDIDIDSDIDIDTWVTTAPTPPSGIMSLFTLTTLLAATLTLNALLFKVGLEDECIGASSQFGGRTRTGLFTEATTFSCHPLTLEASALH